MGDKYFFDIPVFRCTLKQWCVEHNLKKKKLVEFYRFQSAAAVPDFNYEDLAESCLSTIFSSFFYSEMVGMIRLFAYGSQIKGELWFIKNKISRNLKRKSWRFATPKLFEYGIQQHDTDEKIFEEVIKKLKEESRKPPLEKRFVDLESFINAGKHIKYRKLSTFRRR